MSSKRKVAFIYEVTCLSGGGGGVIQKKVIRGEVVVNKSDKKWQIFFFCHAAGVTKKGPK